MEAGKRLTSEGIRTNVTLVFSATQAILAAEIGAYCVSPFLGRLDDVATDGMKLLHDICEIYAVQGYASNVLAASLRHPMHVVDAALAGADIATMPYDVFTKLVKHPLTDSGLERFLADWRKLQGEQPSMNDSPAAKSKRKRGRALMDTIDRSTLEGKLLPELQQIAQTMGIEGSQRLRKAGLIDAIVEASSNGERPGNGEATTSSSRESTVAMGAVATDADGHEETSAWAGAAATAEPHAESATEEVDEGSPSETSPKRRPTTAGPRTIVVRAARIAARTTAKAVPGTHVLKVVTAATAATGTTHATGGAGPLARSAGSSERSAGNARSRSASRR